MQRQRQQHQQHQPLTDEALEVVQHARPVLHQLHPLRLVAQLAGQREEELDLLAGAQHGVAGHGADVGLRGAGWCEVVVWMAVVVVVWVADVLAGRRALRHLQPAAAWQPCHTRRQRRALARARSPAAPQGSSPRTCRSTRRTRRKLSVCATLLSKKDLEGSGGMK